MPKDKLDDVLDGIFGKQVKLTEWERGYRCRRCGVAFLRFEQFRLAARRRLCAFCYGVCKEEECLSRYPEQPLPERTVHRHTQLMAGKRCVDCGDPITHRATRCNVCASKQVQKSMSHVPASVV